DVTLGNVAHDIAGVAQQAFGFVANVLAVLQGAGGMIGDYERVVADGRGQRERAEILADVLRGRRHAPGFFRIGGIVAQHEAVILDRRPAAGRRDDDRLDAVTLHARDPRVDIAPRKIQRLLLAAHVVHERAAAAFARRLDDFDP